MLEGLAVTWRCHRVTWKRCRDLMKKRRAEIGEVQSSGLQPLEGGGCGTVGEEGSAAQGWEAGSERWGDGYQRGAVIGAVLCSGLERGRPTGACAPPPCRSAPPAATPLPPARPPLAAGASRDRLRAQPPAPPHWPAAAAMRAGRRSGDPPRRPIGGRCAPQCRGGRSRCAAPGMAAPAAPRPGAAAGGRTPRVGSGWVRRAGGGGRGSGRAGSGGDRRGGGGMPGPRLLPSRRRRRSPFESSFQPAVGSCRPAAVLLGPGGPRFPGAGPPFRAARLAVACPGLPPGPALPRPADALPPSLGQPQEPPDAVFAL